MSLSDEAFEAKKKYFKEYRENNRERLSEYHKKWRKENPDKVKKNHDAYWERKAKSKE